MELQLRHIFFGVAASVGLHAAAAEFLPSAPPPGALGAGEGGLLISMKAGGAPGDQAADPESRPEEQAEPLEEPQDQAAADVEERLLKEREEAVAAAAEAEPAEDLQPSEPPAETAAVETEAPATHTPMETAEPQPQAATAPAAAEESLEEAEPEAPWKAAPPAPRPEGLAPSPGTREAPAGQQTARLPDAQEGEEPSEAASQGGLAGNGGESDSAGGLAGVPDSYLSELMAWLAKHKAYPERAQWRRQEGTVTLSFVVARDGSLSGQRIGTSSGHRLLDEAAEEMLRRAEPLPAFPPEMSQDRLSLSLPVVFQLQ